MKKLAKVIAVTSALLLIAIVAATGATPAKKIVVGFSQIGAESEWRTANTESIKDACAAAGFELKFADAQQKPENQIKAIRSFIAQKVDVIGFTAVVETGFEAVLKEAKAAKIPVVMIDRAAKLSDDSLYVTFMGSDFIKEGERAATWLLGYMHTAAPVNIVELQGTVGSAPAIERQVGFKSILAPFPNYKIVRTQTGNFTRAEGKTVMESFLKAEKKIDVLFAHNDDMAIGAIQAIEEAGLKPGKDIIIVSIDGVKGAFEAMIAGKLNCTVECSPLLGPQFVDAIQKLMDKKVLPKKTVTIEGVFPAEFAAAIFPSRKY
jgi:simple sugar transport system substrate-binding protein